MKKILIIAAIVIGILIIGQACNDETVSYYKDYNKNGRQDFGEGVYYVDKNGTHFYD